jgi:hypothetical protein
MTDEKSRFGQPDVVPFSDEDAAADLLVNAVQALWGVVNQLTRFRRTRRENYRVTIFGSARPRSGRRRAGVPWGSAWSCPSSRR